MGYFYEVMIYVVASMHKWFLLSLILPSQSLVKVFLELRINQQLSQWIIISISKTMFHNACRQKVYKNRYVLILRFP